MEGALTNRKIGMSLNGKVTKIAFTPKDSVQIKDTGIDYSKFRKERTYWTIKGIYIYYDKPSGIAIAVFGKRVDAIYLFPSKKNYSLLCKNEKIKKYYSSKRWRRYPRLKKAAIDYDFPLPNVVNLTLSRTEVIADCVSLNAEQDKPCQISVSTTAEDLDNDILT